MIYCGKCKYYREVYNDYGGTEWCQNPNNTKVEIQNSYDREREIVTFLKKPRELNKNNNCENFKPNIINIIKNFLGI